MYKSFIYSCYSIRYINSLFYIAMVYWCVYHSYNTVITFVLFYPFVGLAPIFNFQTLNYCTHYYRQPSTSIYLVSSLLLMISSDWGPLSVAAAPPFIHSLAWSGGGVWSVSPYVWFFARDFLVSLQCVLQAFQWTDWSCQSDRHTDDRLRFHCHLPSLLTSCLHWVYPTCSSPDFWLL